MEDATLECGGADSGVVSKQQTGELAQERSMTMRVRTNQPHRFPMLPQKLHDKRQWETMMTRDGESTSP